MDFPPPSMEQIPRGNATDLNRSGIEHFLDDVEWPHELQTQPTLQPKIQEIDKRLEPLTMTSTMNHPITNESTKAEPEKRREQNRKAQRAFRERRDNKLKRLEEKLKHLREEHQCLQKKYDSLRGAYTRMHAGLEVLLQSCHPGENAEKQLMSPTAVRK